MNGRKLGITWSKNSKGDEMSQGQQMVTDELINLLI